MRRPRRVRVEVDASGLGHDVGRRRVELHERRTGVHLGVRRHEHRADAARERRHESRLHLHALDHGDRVARADGVPRRHHDRDHDGRNGRTHDAALVAREPERLTLDIDGDVGAVRDGDRAIRSACDGQPALELTQSFDARVDGDTVELDAIVRRRSTTNPQSVRVVATPQLDDTRQLPLHLRAAARSCRVEPCPVDATVVLVRLDCSLDQRDPRLRSGVTGRAETAVHPLGVVLAATELRTAQDVEQEPLVRRAALHHDLALLDRAGRARECLVTVATPRADRRQQRVGSRRKVVVLRHAGVDPNAWARRHPEHQDAAIRWREVALGVLRAQPHLERVPARHRRFAVEAAPAREVELQLDEIDTCRELGERVLHLQTRVRLDERERLACLREELDRPDVRELRGATDPFRGTAHSLLDVGGEYCALLDHLSVRTLHRAVAHAERPHRAVAVGDDLHLDVARRR